jgi:hypothetical protein
MHAHVQPKGAASLPWWSLLAESLQRLIGQPDIDFFAFRCPEHNKRKHGRRPVIVSNHLPQALQDAMFPQVS